jgi:hypothetical protein
MKSRQRSDDYSGHSDKPISEFYSLGAERRRREVRGSRRPPARGEMRTTCEAVARALECLTGAI